MDLKTTLLNKISSRNAHVCILGLGYVGLPLAVEFARGGLTVTGIDVNAEKCAQIARGESHVGDVVNSSMPHYVVSCIQDALNEEGKPLKGSTILVLGVAYKKDVPDLRESPALTIIEELAARGAEVLHNNPHVPELRTAEGGSCTPPR